MNNGFEQIIATQRALFETAQAVSLKALEGAEKLMALNLAAAKSTVADSADQVDALLRAKDVSKLAEQGVSMAQPAGEKVAAYVKHIVDINTTTGQEIAELLQRQLDANQEAVSEWIDTAAKSAPAGSEPLFTATKNAFSVARGAVEQAVAASRKAAEYAEKAVVTPLKPASKGRKAA